MAAGENRFAPELDEKEVIELYLCSLGLIGVGFCNTKRNTREHKESHKVWHENISSKKLENLFCQFKQPC